VIGGGNGVRLSFRTKLLVSYVALVVVVVLVATFELNRSLGADLVRQLDARLEAQADGAAAWIGTGRHPNRHAGRLARLVGAEIALIDRDGAVIGFAEPSTTRAQGGGDLHVPDTPPPEMPGQNDQPEVRGARAGGHGHATRPGATSGAPMRFVAVATSDGNVLRLGVPLTGIDATLRAMRYRLLFAAVLAIGAAVLLGLAASRVLARPLRTMAVAARKIAGGDYEVRAGPASPDELGELAAALEKMAADLKERIGDLMAERDRLEALLAQVRKLEVVRRDFVANLSHELRTPVTAIQGYSETLLSTSPDDATRERFVATIHRNAQRLGRLLEDLLKLSAIEAQADGSAAREPVPLRALARTVAQTVEERRRARGASIVIEIDEGAAAIGDPGAIEQVLENLVDNALKHGAEGGAVRITAAREGGSVVIRVQDDGPGIPAEHLPRIFERFYRVDPARSRERGGAGLGLAIVKHLVEAMGGSVSASSEPGEGCRFEVRLPAA
jgi:signal transduction histidine kinase